MEPITGALISGGLSLMGNLMGTAANNQNQQQLLQQQEQYQTMMSNTAYQRAAADMKAAGLNPAMMFGSGGPASSPNAPAAQPKQSALNTLGPSMQTAINTAVSLRTANATIDKLIADTADTKAHEAVNKADAISRVLMTDPEVKRSYALGHFAEAQAKSDDRMRELRANTEAERAALLGGQKYSVLEDVRRKRAGEPEYALSREHAQDILAIPRDVRAIANQSAYYGDRATKTIDPVVQAVSSAKGLRSPPKPQNRSVYTNEFRRGGRMSRQETTTYSDQ